MLTWTRSWGVVALCAHLLVERGQLNLNRPVADYWPEFAAGGKAQITVREAMAHRASLAFVDDAQAGDVLGLDDGGLARRHLDLLGGVHDG